MIGKRIFKTPPTEQEKKLSENSFRKLVLFNREELERIKNGERIMDVFTTRERKSMRDKGILVGSRRFTKISEKALRILEE